MSERRTKARTERDLLSGPGKIAQAIGVDGSFSGEDMLARGARFQLVPGEPVGKVLVTTRVGLAKGMGDDKRWRFIEVANLEWASKPWHQR
jgi:DNA-3-methyladenine glycosylase